MTEQEIREGAPDGATHYAFKSGCLVYYKYLKPFFIAMNVSLRDGIRGEIKPL